MVRSTPSRDKGKGVAVAEWEGAVVAKDRLEVLKREDHSTVSGMDKGGGIGVKGEFKEEGLEEWDKEWDKEGGPTLEEVVGVENKMRDGKGALGKADKGVTR